MSDVRGTAAVNDLDRFVALLLAMAGKLTLLRAKPEAIQITHMEEILLT
ncbi:MAG: hypothetical protein KJ626_05655 [Verrucomicrobia bacterium]|nr:hypothetical protein [Verrucomicrobiota bacterium]